MLREHSMDKMNSAEIETRRLRWAAFAHAHGWDTSLRSALSIDLSDLALFFVLGRAFVARTADKRSLRLFSEPRQRADLEGLITEVEQRYGVLIVRHPGLIDPASADLLELVIVDPVRALALFRFAEAPCQAFRPGPLSVHGPRRFFTEYLPAEAAGLRGWARFIDPSHVLRAAHG